MSDPLRATFFDECEELLERLGAALAPGAFGIDAAFRAVHTIKGGAASLGFDTLAAQAHQFETALSSFRMGSVAPDAAALATLTRDADALRARIEGLRMAPPAGGGPATAIAAEGPSVLGLTLRPGAGFFSAGFEIACILAALDNLAKTTVRCLAADLPPLTSLRSSDCHLAWQVTFDPPITGGEMDACLEIAAHALTVTKTFAPPAVPHATTMRVEIARIDHLLNLVGELAIGQTALTQHLAEAGLPRHGAIVQAADLFARIMRDMQDAVIAMRSQPALPLFRRMERAMRETAHTLGKDCKLEFSGETTEIDRLVIDGLVEPLTHLIRNAVDHGIEDAAERERLGKPSAGRLSLGASHRAGRVVIELADDGRGIDPDRIAASARACGLIAATRHPDQAEAMALIFQPGFSTASALSRTSGRGVGLDAAGQAVRALGGRLSVSSTPGRGTRFALSLPLTLAVLDAMLVEAGGQVLALPIASVLETAALGQVRSGGMAPPRQVRLRGQATGLCDLAGTLGLGSADPTALRAVVVLMADEDNNRAAFAVDRVISQRQVVIKGLEDHCGPIPGIAAATILGNGRVALIPDTANIIRTAAAWGQPVSKAAHQHA